MFCELCAGNRRGPYQCELSLKSDLAEQVAEFVMASPFGTAGDTRLRSLHSINGVCESKNRRIANRQDQDEVASQNAEEGKQRQNERTRVLDCIHTTMKVELSIHASNLKNVAGLGKGTSDPFAVVTQIATVPGSKPLVLGKTEV